MRGVRKTPAERLLWGVRRGRVRLDAALESLLESAREPTSEFAVLDHDRARRCGFPEVVLAQGKTPGQTTALAARLFERSGRVLVTRADEAARAALRERFPRALVHDRARLVRLGPAPRPKGRVCVVAAGTADLPVADEAVETLVAMGSRVDKVVDVGVAGIHRLVPRLPLLRRARVAVVVAGMEGALPSVVQGLLDRPVVAVPTSVGYGAHFEGLAALLAMLNSCAAGITVVNIDNGFGAGYAAHLINTAAGPRPASRSASGARARVRARKAR
jgi:NCAIR mutase (PurE)-related protein